MLTENTISNKRDKKIIFPVSTPHGQANTWRKWWLTPEKKGNLGSLVIRINIREELFFTIRQYCRLWNRGQGSIPIWRLDWRMLNAGTSGPYEGRTPKGMCLQSMCRQPANIIFVLDEIKTCWTEEIVRGYARWQFNFKWTVDFWRKNIAKRKDLTVTSCKPALAWFHSFSPFQAGNSKYPTFF